MRNQAREQMMRILPDGFRNDQWRVRINRGEDCHAFFLRADETVFRLWFVRMSPHQLAAEIRDRSRELLFHGRLGGPTFFVRGSAKIAISDEENGRGGHGD